EKVHVAFSIDSHDREVMQYVVSTKGISSEHIQDLMLRTTEYRFGTSILPLRVQWLSDNGGCYTAKGTLLTGTEVGLDIRTTPAYSPESNGLAEAFVKTFKRDYVCFGNLKNAKIVMEQLPEWFEDYNCNAPHKALKMLSPREYINKQLAC
ncbi:MAG: hypothetical protein K0S07_1696, partial [Chlamydiales bacterium]|nr:hypothetical protein [Chlamydiales bacterium]